VKAFLDTSALVAAFHLDHPHHEPSFDLFVRCQKRDSCCSVHSLAEVYSTLTSMPAPRRVSGNEALLFIGNLRDRLTIVALNEEEYFRVAEACADAGLAGGAIYDAIHGYCALKAKAEIIYTWNIKHFLRLDPALADRVRAPGS
jgi:predicted nucleic acid-binding protein